MFTYVKIKCYPDKIETRLEKDISRDECLSLFSSKDDQEKGAIVYNYIQQHPETTYYVYGNSGEFTQREVFVLDSIASSNSTLWFYNFDQQTTGFYTIGSASNLQSTMEQLPSDLQTIMNQICPYTLSDRIYDQPNNFYYAIPYNQTVTLESVIPFLQYGNTHSDSTLTTLLTMVPNTTVAGLGCTITESFICPKVMLRNQG